MPAIPFSLFVLAVGSQVETERLGSNRHLLRIETQARTTFEAAQSALVPTAKRLCADRGLVLGAFKFTEPSDAASANRGAGRATFQQELYCKSPEQDSEIAAPATASPSEAQQQAVLDATYRYLAAKDGGRLSDAYAMLSRRSKLSTPEREWIGKARDFNAQAGAVRTRRVTGISWYSNPPNAPEPGLYVAADLNGAFENVEFLCGYVVWKRDDDGRFRLVREEQNFVERRRDADRTPLDRAPLRAQMGCKD